jgi:hypothetical protein
MFEKTHKDLFERLKRMVLQKATTNQKSAVPSAPKHSRDASDEKPFPIYKKTCLGKPDLDTRGHVGLCQFLDLCLEGAEKQVRALECH